MTSAVVVDASAGVEILTGTDRGKRLAELIDPHMELWVPEHFYAEVFGAIRHLHVVGRRIDRHRAELAIERLLRWHIRQVGLTSLITSAWAHRFNLTGADALYVALTQRLKGQLLTDDHRLINSPHMPREMRFLHLDKD